MGYKINKTQKLIIASASSAMAFTSLFVGVNAADASARARPSSQDQFCLDFVRFTNDATPARFVTAHNASQAYGVDARTVKTWDTLQTLLISDAGKYSKATLVSDTNAVFDACGIPNPGMFPG